MGTKHRQLFADFVRLVSDRLLARRQLELYFLGTLSRFLICLSTMFEQPIEQLTVKLHIKRDCISWNIFRMLRTFFLCVIGRIIFMGHGVRTAARMLYSSVADAHRDP